MDGPFLGTKMKFGSRFKFDREMTFCLHQLHVNVSYCFQILRVVIYVLKLVVCSLKLYSIR